MASPLKTSRASATGQRLGERQQSRHSGWSFFQLRSFVEYKAALAGVPVVDGGPSQHQPDMLRVRPLRAGQPARARRLSVQALRTLPNADLNSARNLAGLGRSNAASKVAVNDPGWNPGEISRKATALQCG